MSITTPAAHLLSAVRRICSRKLKPYAVVESRLSPFDKSNSCDGSLLAIQVPAFPPRDWGLRCQQVAQARGGRSKQGKHCTDLMKVKTMRWTYSEFATLGGSIIGFHLRSPIGLALAIHVGCARYSRGDRRITGLRRALSKDRSSVHNGFARDLSVDAAATVLEWILTRAGPMVASNAPGTWWISAVRSCRLWRRRGVEQVAAKCYGASGITCTRLRMREAVLRGAKGGLPLGSSRGGRVLAFCSAAKGEVVAPVRRHSSARYLSEGTRLADRRA